MGFRYREHLVFPVAYLDPVIGDWTASVHIDFTEKLKIHTVVLRSDDVFQTEVQAKRFITKEPKNRLMTGFALHESQGLRRLVNTSPQLHPGVNKQYIGSVDRVTRSLPQGIN